jgi:Tol biopolymer transport system component
MGEVYRAKDARLGRDVAIKVLPAEVAGDTSRLKRFEKEARAASALNHPNIVTIYEIGASDSVAYIAMERVEGKTLRELLFGGAIPIKKLLAIAAQIADGLARAHEAGIVHRDLKPENLMVTKDGLVKILDFGLAKQTAVGSGSDEGSHIPTETGTSPGVVLGTVGYMSPEQAAGQPVDFRSDQFAFGSILYEMATGKRAFQKGTAVDTLSAILHEEPKPLEETNTEAPTPVRWIIERCHSKDPDGRYASSLDLSRELAKVRDHLSESRFSGVSPAGTSDRPARRRLAVVGLAVGAALLVGALAARFIGTAGTAYPSLHQVTFRRVGLNYARFAPDGQIVYSVATGGPGELYSARLGTPEPRPLGLPPASLIAISSSGDLAVLIGGSPNSGTLATVSLSGGAPRELLADVWRAAWAPDGKRLAVVHRVGDRMRLEFPIGRVLFEEPGLIGDVNFSPEGDRIAFTHARSWIPGAAGGKDLIVSDLAGSKTTIGRVPLEAHWAPRGDELWFNEIDGGNTTFWAMSLSGRKRMLASFAGDFGFHDVSRDGRLLVERIQDESEIVGHFSGDPSERNLSWLDRSIPADLSTDGTVLLFTETGMGGGPKRAVYKRRTDGSPAVRLGEGLALALSPDGLWALSLPSNEASQLVLLPTGAGQPRTLTVPGLQLIGATAIFFPDGKRVLLRARNSAAKIGLYVLEVGTGKVRTITPEGIHPLDFISLSPDGKAVVSSSDKGTILYDVEGGPSRPVPGVPANLVAIKWCADGHSLFVRTMETNPLRVYRMELSSGHRTLWKEFSFSDIGENGSADVFPTPDGRSYVYGYTRSFADLFIADGLKW